MSGNHPFNTKTDKAVAVIVIILIITAIAAPVYISTIDNTVKEVTAIVNTGTEVTANNIVVAPYVSEGNLTFADRRFYLNGKATRIVSGAIHYFRTVPELWRDRLRKLKACGMNTVETYVLEK